MIEFSDVGLRYGNGPEILRDLTFSVEPGSFHFLTGPSGAGKTSLLRLLLLSLKPSRGKVTMFGEDVSTLTQDRLLQMRRSCNLLSRSEMVAGKTPTTPTISSIIAGVQAQEAVKLLHGLPTISGKGRSV